ncbi:MAG TPA: hypothetical protein VNT50_07390 [Microbacterium sp.]|uniref:hypothetical protein n=1 Tax=Microbacterium sp. TaxID=51671 RepID=UPI002C3A14C4|nr:hypothetical protein [Microbacterium sp.]HWI31298.1 hypothetical protein [Microbacterium sp.]
MTPDPPARGSDPPDDDTVDDETIRVRRSARRAPAAAPAPTKGADADSDPPAGIGGRVAFRPDALAAHDPIPIRTPAPVVVPRSERSPTEPQQPQDAGEVGHAIRSRARLRAATLVVVALAVMATAAALLVALVSGLG